MRESRSVIRAFAIVLVPIWLCVGWHSASFAAEAGETSRKISSQSDKAAHLGLSALGVQACMRFGQLFNSRSEITVLNRVISSVLVIAAGTAKEMIDVEREGNTFSDQDMAANAGGVIVGNLLFIEF